jgi:S1-C subfamily serine protease
MSNIREFSKELAAAAAAGGKYTVMVDARGGYAASGIALEPQLVLTADHVVEREEEIPVGLPDGTRTQARLLGRDASTDLALLATDSRLAALAEAAPEEPPVGELVLALGRPTEEGLEASLGIITARGGPLRTHWGGELERYLGIDGSHYPGFSGGPLVDVEGRWLGVSVYPTRYGAGVVVPAALARTIAEKLKSGGVRRGYLGIRSQTVELSAQLRQALARSQESGLLLVGVEEASPAATSGLMVGDIITGFEGNPIGGHEDLLSRLRSASAGQTVELEVLRAGQLQKVKVTLGERRRREGSGRGVGFCCP